MEAFEIPGIFVDIVCKAKIADPGSNIYRITLNDRFLGYIKKTNNDWLAECEVNSGLLTRDIIQFIGSEIDKRLLIKTPHFRDLQWYS